MFKMVVLLFCNQIGRFLSGAIPFAAYLDGCRTRKKDVLKLHSHETVVACQFTRTHTYNDSER